MQKLLKRSKSEYRPIIILNFWRLGRRPSWTSSAHSLKPLVGLGQVRLYNSISDGAPSILDSGTLSSVHAVTVRH